MGCICHGVKHSNFHDHILNLKISAIINVFFVYTINDPQLGFSQFNLDICMEGSMSQIFHLCHKIKARTSIENLRHLVEKNG